MLRTKSVKLGVELLEDRCVPAANSVLLQNGVLNIIVDPKVSHVAIVSQPTADTVQVALDGKGYTFNATVTQVNYLGGERGDRFTNLTGIGGVLNFGKGDDIVFSKAANQLISGGAGNNFVQDQAGGSTITVGNGNNNIYGGPNDTISVGSGNNIIYSILGPATVNIAAHKGTNYVFVSAAGTVNGAQASDRVAVFFADNRQIGSGALVLEKGTLYFAANHNGNQLVLSEVGKKIVATYNLNDGVGFRTQVFDRTKVNLIANFGGSGDDVFINNTSIADVQYGAGGNNLLVGGFGPLNLEKAGGAAGTSIAIGRSPIYNDLNGSGSANVTTLLIVNPHAKQNVIRTNNPADSIVGFKKGRDVFISPFKLQGKGTMADLLFYLPPTPVVTPPAPVSPPRLA